jgi:hypothetical protein
MHAGLARLISAEYGMDNFRVAPPPYVHYRVDGDLAACGAIIHRDRADLKLYRAVCRMCPSVGGRRSVKPVVETDDPGYGGIGDRPMLTNGTGSGSFRRRRIAQSPPPAQHHRRPFQNDLPPAEPRGYLHA